MCAQFNESSGPKLFTKMSLTTVILKPGEGDRIVAGHPWIYAGAVWRLTQPANDGDVVQVKDSRQRFLGMGVYNSKSKINVRVLSADRVEIDDKFFEDRIRAAVAIREKHLPKATSFRVINSESDFLSGLIVDKYEDILVMQISALGMEKRKESILRALKKIFSPRAIVERSESSYRKFEGMEEINGIVEGEFPEGKKTIRLNGIQFNVDIIGGHKTGMYLDQQVNYQKVADLIRGGQVLDCFTFLGGFALHAARAGAARVHALDQSKDALAAAQKNAQANNVDDRCTFEETNVFDWLKSQTTVGPNEKLIPKFDTIILDPPSFTRTRAALPEALRGYKEIHLRALKLLKPGGTLATFCCSHHVDAVTYQDVILSAAFDARKVLRRVATYSQSPDHPIIPSIPETEYLKGYAFELVR